MKNKQRLRSKKIRQTGGGPLNSIMSMIPFIPKGSTPISNQPSLNNPAIEQQNSQNVLVGALCNQFVKNNIKGNNTSTYDGVLDNLCSNQQVGLPARINSVYSSNSLSQNNLANISQNSVEEQSNNVVSESTNQEGGDFQMPSFLSGVKGFAKMYSAPLRMGLSAIKGIATSKKNNKPPEPPYKKIKHSKKLRNKKRKSKKKNKNKLRLKEKHQQINKYKDETLDEEIARVEKELEEEKKEKNAKNLAKIRAGLENNIELDTSKIKK